MNHLLDRLEQDIKSGLPGLKAQVKMAPHLSRAYYEVDSRAKKAAVLILLYPKYDQNYFALIKRRSVKGDTHSGQVSLPGGRMESNDSSLVHTALRETEEELGVVQKEVKVIGQLSDLYVFASNHMVSPFVGSVQKKPDFIPDPREVDWLIEASADSLLKPDAIKKTDLVIRGHKLNDVSYYDIEDQIVWGATAMILSEFLEIYRNISS